MPLALITPPATEPITLTQAKAHLRIDTADDDALISALITAARARAEWHTGRALITQSWIQWFDAWPRAGVLEIALPPLQSVASITTYARDGASSTLDPSHYSVDLAGNRIALRCVAPANPRAINALAVAISAGYGDAVDVPEALKQAILQLTAFLYEHRGEAPAELPQDALALLAPYRVLKL